MPCKGKKRSMKPKPMPKKKKGGKKKMGYALLFVSLLAIGGCTTPGQFVDRLDEGLSQIETAAAPIRDGVEALKEQEAAHQRGERPPVGIEELLITGVTSVIGALGAVGVWRGSPNARKGKAPA